MSHGRAGYSALHYEVKTGKKNLGEKGVSRCGSRFIKSKIGGVGYNYLVVVYIVWFNQLLQLWSKNLTLFKLQGEK